MPPSRQDGVSANLPLLAGVRCFWQGLALLPKPGIRWMALLPVLISGGLFLGGFGLLWQQLVSWANALLPASLQWLSDIIIPLLMAAMWIFSLTLFTMLVNIFAAIFNSFLAEQVEQHVLGSLRGEAFSWARLPVLTLRILLREVQKLLYYLPRLLIVFVLTLLPVINALAPLVWFIFGAWMMAIQYADYCADNQGIRFAQLKHTLKQHRLASLGFGSMVMLGLLIPVLNILVLPTAVSGATLLWLQLSQQNPKTL